MLLIHPADDEKKNELISTYSLPADSTVLIADDDDRLVGFVAFEIGKSSIKITNISAQDDDMCELLLRSAFNFAERRLLFEIESLVKEPETVFKKLGFCEKNKKFVSNITNVVHVCKNCGK